jgi:histidinol phosphatase-like PHP family hydrolase
MQRMGRGDEKRTIKMDKAEIKKQLELHCTVSADRSFSYATRQEAREIVKRLVALAKEKGFMFVVVVDSLGNPHVEEKK